METVAPLAGTISTYGLYAIAALLVAAVIYLYKHINKLDDEFKEILKTTICDNNRIVAENTKALEAVIKLIEAQGELIKDRKK